jgi:diacylglycerol kinase (ATP)
MNRFKADSLPHSFYYAIRGVLRSLKNERNLRIHFFAVAYVLYFSRYFQLEPLEYAVLFLALGSVLVCELVNTAIESAINLYSDSYNNYAEFAKDAAAGAVLVSAAVSVAVGVALFWRPDTLLAVWRDVISAPVIWLFALGVTVFLIAWPDLKGRKSKKAPEYHL